VPIDGVGIKARETIDRPAPTAKAVNAAVKPIAKVPAIAAVLPTAANPAIAAIAILFP
jgi:hypothetical protein